MSEATEVLIVGGGVCGTRLADLLRMRGVPFLLAEARDQLGGRIRTLRLDTPARGADCILEGGALKRQHACPSQRPEQSG